MELTFNLFTIEIWMDLSYVNIRIFAFKRDGSYLQEFNETGLFILEHDRLFDYTNIDILFNRFLVYYVLKLWNPNG